VLVLAIVLDLIDLILLQIKLTNEDYQWQGVKKTIYGTFATADIPAVLPEHRLLPVAANFMDRFKLTRRLSR